MGLFVAHDLEKDRYEQYVGGLYFVQAQNNTSKEIKK